MVGQYVAPGTPVLRVHGGALRARSPRARGGSSSWPASARSTRTPRSRCGCWSTSRSAPCHPPSTIRRPPSRRSTGSRSCSSSCIAAHPGPVLVLDGDGVPAGRVPAPTWTDYLELAVTEIRHYGGGSVQVCRRLHALYDHLLAEVDEPRAAPRRARAAAARRGRWPRRSPTRRTRPSPPGPTASASAPPASPASGDAARPPAREAPGMSLDLALMIFDHVGGAERAYADVLGASGGIAVGPRDRVRRAPPARPDRGARHVRRPLRRRGRRRAT